jgi:hypothetical protein
MKDRDVLALIKVNTSVPIGRQTNVLIGVMVSNELVGEFSKSSLGRIRRAVIDDNQFKL